MAEHRSRGRSWSVSPSAPASSNPSLTPCADDVAHLGKKARLWGKKKVERESAILGDGSEDSVLPADFSIPHENTYATPPPGLSVELLALKLSSPAGSVPATPFSEIIATSAAESCKGRPDMLSYPASVKFYVSIEGKDEQDLICPLNFDINFVTAHPCAPSHRVKMLKSPSSPTIQKIDVSGSDMLGKGSRSAYRMGSTPIATQCSPTRFLMNLQAIRYTNLTITRSSTSLS